MGMSDYRQNYNLQHKAQIAERLESEGKLLHAVQIHRAIIEEYPDYFESYFKLAAIYEKLDNFEAGYELLNELLQEFPEEKIVRLGIGQFLFRNQMWNETIETLSYFLPEDEPLVSFFIGYSYFMLKEFELAKISFQTFITYAEKSEFLQDAFLYLAKAHINLGEYNEALVYLKKAETFYKGHYELYLLYAVVYYFLSMEQNALYAIDIALQLKRNDPLTLEWAGKIYFKVKNFLKAEEFYKKYLELAEVPTSEIYSDLAVTYLNLQKINEAINYFELALKLNPQNKVALEALKSFNELNENRMAKNE